MKVRSSNNSSNRKWSGKTNGGDFGLEFLVSLLGRIPLSFGYAFLDVVLPFYLPFNRKGFRATRLYFKDRIGVTSFNSFLNAYATHRLFGQMMFDRFRFYTKDASGYTISVDGNDRILEKMQGADGFIIAGSHVGSMEMAGYMLGLKDKPINAVVYGGEAASLQKYRSSVLSDHGIKMVPVSEDLSHLFIIKSALEKGEIVSMPCDRLFGSNKSVECNFIGAPAHFPFGAFILAAQMEKEIIALFNVKEGKRTYKVFVRPITVDTEGLTTRKKAEELTKKYVQELESIVRLYPRQWFNFYDFWETDE